MTRRRLSPATCGLLGLAAALSFCLVAPAGAKVEKDPRKGEYYTNDEILKLSRGDRDDYCEMLENYLDELREDTGFFEHRVDSLSTALDTLRAQSLRLSSDLRDLNTELRDLRLRRNSIQSYVVQENDNLRDIAKLVYGDPTRWKAIYDANRDKIKSEDAPLAPGTKLKIPRTHE
jgi:nucleoid-associated protein YgaU